MEEKQKSIGGLWLREGKSGNKFMYGSIEIDGQKHEFFVFKNKYKQQDKHPDYQIFPPKEKKPLEPKRATAKDYADVDEGSIPF